MTGRFRFLAILASVILGGGLCFGESALPALTATDVLIQARADGFHLWIRHQDGVGSVMLTESFESPEHQWASYALRAVEANPVNDGEPRLLNGQPLPLPHHSLLSSTVKADPEGRPAFEIVMPRFVEFGSRTNPNSRYGRWDLNALLEPQDAPVWFSIRTFAKPFADYSGAYRDNAFSLSALKEQQIHRATGKYEDGLVEGFSRLGPSYAAQDIDDALAALPHFFPEKGGSLEVVVAIDTTQSMAKSLQTLARKLIDVLKAQTGYSSVRVGLVFYRDYMEDYLTQTVDFTNDWESLQAHLSAARAAGGGDIPEAVVEALWAGLNSFDWTADQRLLILMGDAPQHATPRGAVTEEMVRRAAIEKQVKLHLVMLPQSS